MRCEGESRFAVDLEWIATASILVRVEVEYGLAAVIPLCRDVVRMRRFFFGGVTAQVLQGSHQHSDAYHFLSIVLNLRVPLPRSRVHSTIPAREDVRRRSMIKRNTRGYRPPALFLESPCFAWAFAISVRSPKLKWSTVFQFHRALRTHPVIGGLVLQGRIQAFWMVHQGTVVAAQEQTLLQTPITECFVFSVVPWQIHCTHKRE